MWMFSRKQAQKQSGPGLAVQAGQNVVVNVSGVTPAEARLIALDVFRSNLLEFRGVAQQVAVQRGEEITEKFITKLQEENPEGLQQAQTPDFQDALFTMQKEYAKAGDEDLADLLVDLLVDRTKQKSRSMLQIVLNESLHTAPKLTPQQVATLSVVFFLRHVQFNGIGSIDALGKNLRKYTETIVDDIAVSAASFGHLQFTGCGSHSLGSIQLEEIWRRLYPGLFKRGFDVERVEQAQLSEWTIGRLITTCLNDPSKLQVAALNHEVLKEKLVPGNLSDAEKEKVIALMNEGELSLQEIKEKVIGVAPFMENVLSQWTTSPLKNFELTSVGMAIGHANIKRTTGEFSPLSIWIN